MASRRLLILHGAGGRGARHSEFLRLARARGFEAEAPDLPGHGHGVLDGGVLEWVRSRCGSGAALRGGSLGAYLALHAAAREPRPAAVVALAPTGEALIRRRFAEWNAEIDAESFLHFLGQHDVYDAATRIDAPVLYVVARDDARIPLAHVERLHAMTPGSELVVRETGGHSGPSHDPAVHSLTLDWLDRQLG